MSVVIKSGAGSTEATVDSTANALRVIQYDAAGNVQTPTTSLITFGTAGNIPQAITSTVDVANTAGFASVQFYITPPTGGTVSFQGTFDGVNYTAITLRSSGNIKSYVQSTATAGTYVGSCAGMRTIRFLVSVGGSATGTVRGTFSFPASTIEGIEQGAPSDYELQLGRGLIVGQSVVNKFGRNPDIDTGTVPEDIWNGGGVYTGFPSTAAVVELLSSSVNDAAAGTGARTVIIRGLDASYNQITETITLNGTSPSTASTLLFLRVHSATTVTAGSGGVNAGTITCRHVATPANIFFVMPIGFNQTAVSAYTIPAGYTGYMRKLNGVVRSTTAGSVDGYIWTAAFGGVFRARRPFTFSNVMPLNDTIYGGLIFTEKSDLVIRITAASTSNIDASCNYDLVLVAN